MSSLDIVGARRLYQCGSCGAHTLPCRGCKVAMVHSFEDGQAAPLSSPAQFCQRCVIGPARFEALMHTRRRSNRAWLALRIETVELHAADLSRRAACAEAEHSFAHAPLIVSEARKLEQQSRTLGEEWARLCQALDERDHQQACTAGADCGTAEADELRVGAEPEAGVSQAKVDHAPMARAFSALRAMEPQARAQARILRGVCVVFARRVHAVCVAGCVWYNACRMRAAVVIAHCAAEVIRCAIGC